MATIDQIRKVKPGDRPSASQANTLRELVGESLRRTMRDGIVDSTGAHSRTTRGGDDGDGGGGVVMVNVALDGGSNGTKLAAATYTYTVTHAITGEWLMTGASPAWNRAVGAVHAATHGTAYYVPSGGGGGWVLWQVDEQPMVGC